MHNWLPLMLCMDIVHDADALVGSRRWHAIHHHLHHEFHHFHALFHHLLTLLHVAWHRLFTLHASHAGATHHAHRRHAILHGFHVFGHQCLLLLRRFGVHHFFVHLAHGPHLAVHSGHLGVFARPGCGSPIVCRRLLDRWCVRVMLRVLCVGLGP